MANENKRREIRNNPSGSAPSFTFTPAVETTIGTGITSIDFGLDDANNELEIGITFLSDIEKPDFIAGGSIVVGDVVFDNLVDLGAGLDVVQVISVANEATMQSDINTFLATKRIEIRY